jgi:hypothetical protein
MGRKPEKQRRIGAREKQLIGVLIRKVKGYRIFADMRDEHETSFNKRLMDHLRQKPDPLEVGNKNIPAVILSGEKFRPEFYLKRGASRNLAAVECKRLTKSSAKSRWKEGLSQAVLYSTIYKSVLFVLFDFTRGAHDAAKFRPGNTAENRFAKKLRDKWNIHIIALKPEKK